MEVSGEARRGRGPHHPAWFTEQGASLTGLLTSSASGPSTHHHITIPGKEACTVSPTSTPEGDRRALG